MPLQKGNDMANMPENLTPFTNVDRFLLGAAGVAIAKNRPMAHPFGRPFYNASNGYDTGYGMDLDAEVSS